MNPRRNSNAAYVSVVSVLVMFLGASAWIVGRDIPAGISQLDPPPSPVTAEVLEGTQIYASPATLKVAYGQAASVLSPPMTALSGEGGIVTSVQVAAGSSVVAGDTIYTVDEVPIIAYATPGVFYRELKEGDRGEDVLTLQLVLTEILPEFDLHPDGDFGPATTWAVKALEDKQGFSEPSGVFNPAYLLHLPVSPYCVHTVDLVAGAPAPEPGHPILTADSEALSAVLSTSDSFMGPDGVYAFVAQGKSIEVSRVSGSWLVGDPSQAGNLAPVSLDADAQIVEGNVQLIKGVFQITVPASAVVVDGDNTCVAVVDTQDVYRLQAVELNGTALDGSPFIVGDLPQGSTVLVNPNEILKDVKCP